MKKIGIQLLVLFLLAGTARGQDFFRHITVKQADQLIQNRSDTSKLIILDVRTKGEYSKGHIRSAINIDYWGKNFADSVSRLDKSMEYLVYCTSGVRSSGAMKKMKVLGFTRIWNMKRGMMGWRARKLPLIESGSQRVPPESD